VLIQIMGLHNEQSSNEESAAIDGVMNLVLDLRQQARANKDWPTADKIRDDLAIQNIVIKDGKEGSSWNYN